ncbi:MAG: hypothetical protein ACE5F1_13030, partial [Planctomycetota bacterium]
SVSLVSLLLSSTLLAQGIAVEGEPRVVPGTAPAHASGAVTPAPAGAPTILPKAFATVMGNSANSIPWSWTPTRFQQPFLGSEMPRVLPIRCIGFRHGFRTDTGATIDLEVWLGYTSFDHTTITTNYASNQNSGTPVLVYTRKKFKVPDMVKGNMVPSFFLGQIPLDRPFVWIRQTGRNLLFECKVHGNSAGNRSFSSFWDNTNRLSGSTTSRIWSNNNANATTGFKTSNYGPILSFDVKCKVNADYSIYGKGCPGTGGFAGQVLPARNATTWGASNNYFGVGRSNMRYQQIMNGADFGTKSKTLTGLSYRQDDRTPGRGGGSQTVRILVGQSNLTFATIGFIFNANFDAKGSKLVFSGTVNLPNQTGLNTNLAKFWQYAKFTSPYVWVPVVNKDFLIEIVNASTSSVFFFQDAASSPLATTARVYAHSAVSTRATAGTRNYGLVMGLNVPGGTGTAIPSISASGRPIINATNFSVDLNLAKASTAAILTLGTSDKKAFGLTLPFNLTPLGMTGCTLLASMEILRPGATDATGTAVTKLPVPNNTAFVGRALYSQYLIADRAANRGGWVWTAGGKMTIGEQ